MKQRQKLYRALPWLVLAAAYLFTVGMYALYGSHNLNSDHSSEMVLAQLLNEEGKLITDSWYYSTELRVVSHVPAYQLGLLLFPDNWHAAHTLALALLHAGVAACVIYMLRGAGFREGAVYGAAALLLPVSAVHDFLFSFGGGYTAFIMLGCIMVGMVLRMHRGRFRALRLILLLVLGFWGGLSGVRMPMFSGAPLALACALELFFTLRKTGSLREALKSDQAMVAASAFLSTAAMLAGYVVNAKVLSQIYHFMTYDATTLGELDFSLILEQIRCLMVFFGYEGDVSLMSLSGIANVLAMALVLLMGGVALTWLRKQDSLSMQGRILLYFTLFAVALGVVINILTNRGTNEYAVGYYMMGVFMLVLLVFMQMERMACAMQGVRVLSMLMLSAVFFFQAKVYTAGHIRASESEHEKAAAWLVENGYTTGYATYWNGNVMTEASNGKLDMYFYTPSWTDPELFKWLQRTSHFEGYPEGPVFVYVEEQEALQGPVPLAQEDHLIWEAESGSARIYEYSSGEEVDRIMWEFRRQFEAERAAQAEQ